MHVSCLNCGWWYHYSCLTERKQVRIHDFIVNQSPQTLEKLDLHVIKFCIE